MTDDDKTTEDARATLDALGALVRAVRWGSKAEVLEAARLGEILLGGDAPVDGKGGAF